ncbi:MAG: DUF423 domain-containing protein [Bacteroidetes bacterium]|nr:DUF423 domain-containing protein [Bacteroidota bacterium]
MNKKYLLFGFIAAGTAVMLGAFGAHLLKDQLPSDQLQTFETAVRYQFYHAFALIVTGLLAEKFSSRYFIYAGNLFVAGIIFFSGSLYLLSTKNLLGIESWKFLGPVTPLGGLCFILAWFMLAAGIFKK